MPIFSPRKFTFFPFLILFKIIESIDMTPCVISFLVYFATEEILCLNFLMITKPILSRHSTQRLDIKTIFLILTILISKERSLTELELNKANI